MPPAPAGFATAPSAALKASLADRYRIERELGQGGMATVYLAHDTKHDRDVALKVLRPELAAILGRERFLAEVRLTAKLDHPHILTLLDSGESDGFVWYTLPYIRGESLRQKLQREQQLGVDEAVNIARQIAGALEHAHQHGIIHRDVKPENILLHEGEAMLADFGIALAVKEAGGQRLTETGLSIGTPQYMSPEQATAERQLDARSDVYSLGAVLYEMLAGEPPFTGITAQAVIAKLMVERPTALRTVRDSVTAGLEAVVARSLAKVPADRFPSAAAFAEALTAGTASAPAPAGGRKPIPRGVMVAGVVTVAVALAWLGWRTLRPTVPVITFANTRQLTREPTLEMTPVISPDGREVAYSAGYRLATHIEVRDISGGQPRSLTENWQGAQARPRWLEDGGSIAFRNFGVNTDYPAGWYLLPRTGGQAQVLDGMPLPGGQTLVRKGDSTFARKLNGTRTLLWVGGQTHSPAWSPDGTRLAYVSGNAEFVSIDLLGNIAPSSIWVARDGSPPAQVTDAGSLNVSPAWLPDGNLLFISDRDGPRDLYLLPLDRSLRPRGPPVRLTTGLNAFSVSVSADGSTLAYDRFTWRRNIYALPIPGAGSASIREARPLTSLDQTVEAIALSRDGHWLAYDSNLDRNQDIYVIPAAGGDSRRVTRDPGGDFNPDFSPDGNEIVFHSTRNGTRDIYLINTDGTGEQRLTNDSVDSRNPTFSPDGLRIAYWSPLSGGGRIRILRRDHLGGAWSDASPPGIEGGGPIWSPDGAHLLVFNRGLELVTPAGSKRRLWDGRLDGRVANVEGVGWFEDGRRIHFTVDNQPGKNGLYVLSISGGPPRLLVRFDDPAIRVGSEVAAGHGQLYFAMGVMESDIFVMDVVRR